MTNPPSKVECDAALEYLREQCGKIVTIGTVHRRIAHLEQEVEKLQKAINEGYAYKYMTDDSPTLSKPIREATDEG